ncbi:NAD-dependent epimerase/dehydratase family protein [Roseomonas sp. OT10]|uniref:NAD-dependent epimerase/dehydratase family protein n=1 Tax=Roseomonas cutis TaxID=2897332 RepID=UPI001E350837|nr:NAD-dependent epimerase/dehydratase family protein [Roseomonas sp. OT10]UFN47721.1 NAD-dependent epimerase/dehydratase family protein [Roseomonas sp. OT10]
MTGTPAAGGAAPLAGARVLVTGAAGFIGAHLARRLLGDGATVLGLDSLNAYYDPALKRDRLAALTDHPAFAFRPLDIAEPGALEAAWAAFRPDMVAHLAAQAGVRYSLKAPRDYARANLDGFLEVLEAARAHPVRHLVYASSSSVYGSSTRVPFREDDPVDRPSSLYAATKRANELMAASYGHLFGLPLTGLRFFTVYGPWGRPDMAYWGFTQALFEGREIQLFNHGKVWRDFTYVDEVVEAIARLLPLPPSAPGEPGRPVPEVPHRIFNIGNHTPVPVGEMIDILERHTNREAIRREVPMQPGDVERTWADVSALQAAVGFAPRTSLEEGLGRFVAWYRHYHGVV